MNNQTTFSLFSFNTDTHELSSLSHADWLNFFGSFGGSLFSAIIAALIAWYLYWLQNRKIIKQQTFKEIAEHNEITVYLSTYLELAYKDIEGLVLQLYQQEKKLVEKKFHELAKQTLTFGSIPALPRLKDDMLLAKIANAQELEPENYKNILRLSDEIKQYNSATDSRTQLIQKVNGIKQIANDDRISQQNYLQVIKEMHDRTLIMIFMSEGILDKLIYLNRELSKISKAKRKELNQDKKTGKKIYSTSDNEYHLIVRKQLKAIVDSFPDWKNRLILTPF